MTRKTSLCFAVAAVLALAMASDSQAFWGSRGGWGGGGSSGGGWGGSGGSSGSSGSSGSWGSNGSSGSNGGFLSRIFNHRGGCNDGCGSCGGWGGSSGSAGSNGSSGSGGSAGGAAYYGGGGGYYTATPAPVTYAVAKAQSPVKTQLTLHVPADAKVTLAGVTTKQTGELRQFTTSQLSDGQAWKNYQVVVEMDRNGKTVREERTITLVGGQAQALSISAGEAKLARLTP